MSAERVGYFDSSAIVKLAVAEPESAALRRHVHRQRTMVTSALARTEVTRVLVAVYGPAGLAQAEAVLGAFDLVRITDRILRRAAILRPTDVRSLDAVHLATAAALGTSLRHVVTYDQRMAQAARESGMKVLAPA